MSLGFGKAEYLPGEDLVITIKVRNVGDAPANDVRLSWVEDPGHPLPEDQKPGANTPPASAGGAGGAGDGTDDALAQTGASALGLGLLGTLLVAFGFGASIVGRRRTA